MKLEHGTEIKFDFPLVGIGKSGYGFYCYKRGNSSMRKYYGNKGVLSLELPDEDVLDLTNLTNYNHCKDFLKKELNNNNIRKKDFQSMGNMLNFYIRKFYPEKKAFINFHFGDKIPNSKEIVVFDLSSIYNLKWIKDPEINWSRTSSLSM